MHISDGVLPMGVTVGTYVGAALVCAWSLKQTKHDDLPKVAVVTSSFFVASLIHVPVGPTSVHLLLPGLVGVLLGNSGFLAVALGLVLQALLFQFGGITALGANALMMGTPALFAGWIFRRLGGTSPTRRAVVAGFAGTLGVVMAGVILAILLSSAGEDFFGVAKLALAAHIPVMIIEGVITGFTVSFVGRVKPELLETSLTASF